MTRYLVADAAIMLRRSLRRMRRYPSLTFFVAAMPVVFMLVFVEVLGGAMGAGLAPGPVVSVDGSAGRAAYLAYVMPGILLFTVAGAGQGTAISVAMDLHQGIVARFRTMAISRSSVLVGHVLGSVLQAAIAALVVLAVAIALGFRPATGPADWLGAIGLMALAAVAVSWLSVALGLAAGSVETASNTPMILTLLLFFGSGFVPTATMPDPLRWFAEVQPFTPIIETLRGLLLGTPIGHSAPIALAWCAVVGVASAAWAARLYERLPARPGG